MTAIPDPMRSFLAALADALDVPASPYGQDAETRHRIHVEERIYLVQLAIRDVLAGKDKLGLDWETAYLRRQITERPPTYRTLAEQIAADKAKEGRTP
ncbi:hypothetical protein ACFXGT_28400 [Streptomyces sp. NPDC059352]|uniref:hypothetical protein n=1 Tax=Streptomyces sp. NPDC059352 TaxID=3346810 RepID=UPI0036A63B1A